MQPRRRCRRASTQSTSSNESPIPATPSAVGSCLTSSEGGPSPDRARSPPSQLQSLQSEPEVVRAAGTESVLVVIPHFVVVKPARDDAMHDEDPA